MPVLWSYDVAMMIAVQLWIFWFVRSLTEFVVNVIRKEIRKTCTDEFKSRIEVMCHECNGGLANMCGIKFKVNGLCPC